MTPTLTSSRDTKTEAGLTSSNQPQPQAPKRLEDLSILEINAEIGVRMELIELAQGELRQLRQRRAFIQQQQTQTAR